MFVPCIEQVASEFSRGALDDSPLGIFIVIGASTIELFGRLESLGTPEAISTCTKQPPLENKQEGIRTNETLISENNSRATIIQKHQTRIRSEI